MVPEMNQYPGVFFIDAHQQTSGYFFPPNEDPVHHEISTFALDFIQNQIGPALQRAFNDQSAQYQNYNSYDLFTPEYGDTVPVADHGRGRHDVREGQQRGLRQAGLRPLPRDRHDAQPDRRTTRSTSSATGSASGARPSTRARRARCSRTSSSARCTTRSSSSPEDLQGLRLLLQARPAHRRHGRDDRAAAEDRRPRLQARHAGGRQRLPRVRQRTSRRHVADRAQRPDAARRDALHPDGAGHEALDPGAAGREPVHPVRLLLRRRDLELPAPARPRGLRLPDAADVPGHRR